MNKSHFLLLGVIIGVSLFPIAIAVTEPNIIIDMVLDQTTDPFVIKNSTGFTKFSVDSDGIATSDSNPRIFRVATDNSIVTIANANDNTNPIFVWEIDIDRNGEATTQWHRGHVGVVAEARRISGSGSCTVGWLSSSDSGATWGTLVASSFSNDGAFQDTFNNSAGTNLGDSTTNIGFGYFNSDGATTCEVKNATSIIKINKPFHMDFDIITEPVLP